MHETETGHTSYGVLAAAIFDVDGVLLASPHERAWREALAGFADPAKFSTEMYQAHVAGRPRQDGALAALRALHVPGAERLAGTYAERKQKRLEDLIRANHVAAFPDAVRMVQAMRALGWRLAVASSSKNANAMLQAIPVEPGLTLLDLFGANVCGRDLPAGKPDPAIFRLAAADMQMAPERCLVVEDAPAGIAAGRAGHMATLGVARLGDAAKLRAAGADLTVTNLGQVDIDELAAGRLRSRAP